MGGHQVPTSPAPPLSYKTSEERPALPHGAPQQTGRSHGCHEGVINSPHGWAQLCPTPGADGIELGGCSKGAGSSLGGELRLAVGPGGPQAGGGVLSASHLTQLINGTRDPELHGTGHWRRRAPPATGEGYLPTMPLSRGQPGTHLAVGGGIYPQCPSPVARQGPTSHWGGVFTHNAPLPQPARDSPGSGGGIYPQCPSPTARQGPTSHWGGIYPPCPSPAARQGPTSHWGGIYPQCPSPAARQGPTSHWGGGLLTMPLSRGQAGPHQPLGGYLPTMPLSRGQAGPHQPLGGYLPTMPPEPWADTRLQQAQGPPR
ncbi:translation initiation factor IF-2-like isoform X2 [Gopherus evgoodei]|uniref:translation initiation factor IF-2-like isoform X2 n=1 Tax=Gopherus evgoodei TaxID=1825980 RepID=UPI0011CEF12F|nr:translation initiation factor IF-2-like isoform X2 [Gopherus evgoodei]